ncbi:MAG: Uma2 family endonuclease [Thiotrichaceae bacterium]|nr:Uma2 family endonuclease [Thiotrichaceae bacterium]
MSPSMNHSRLQVALGAAFLGLNNYAVYSELSIDIQGKEFVPNIAIYPMQPINLLNDKISVSEPPLLIVEILSPTQNIQELLDKFKIYFEFGVQSCWLLLPISHAITVFNNLEETPLTYANDKVIDKALGITLNMNKIFLD